ncbi:hypothetical protein EV182_004534 [Spiromyces aspiralis]|uniref:Uncharacterized protein n=1 Tax=Spiromyces aspiralis TaxID=68401 RepID=A0ACC1HCU6_9FUNG|nr:hypothetical protein EV182_004534 [Spiromyces aspiralis]
MATARSGAASPKGGSNAVDEAALERMLKQQEAQLPRDQEIERILSTFRLDPFEILQVPVVCTPAEIKLAYRKKSLLIHPDKAQHPRAQEAFEALKKAEAILTDDKQKEYFTKLMWDAEKDLKAKWRSEIKKGRRPESDLADEDSEKFRQEVKQHYQEFVVEVELRKRQQRQRAMEMEGEEERKRQEAAEELKRKREREKEWEDSREERVSNWREFMKSGGLGKKKKKTTTKKKVTGTKTTHANPENSYIKRVGGS